MPPVQSADSATGSLVHQPKENIILLEPSCQVWDLYLPHVYITKRLVRSGAHLVWCSGQFSHTSSTYSHSGHSPLLVSMQSIYD